MISNSKWFSVVLTMWILLLHSKGSYSNRNYERRNVHNSRIITMKNHGQLEEMNPRVLQTRPYLHKPRNIIGNPPKRQRRPFLRTEKSLRLQYAGLSPKEKLSARILEEIESLDALKCLPKALCSMSAEASGDAHSLLSKPMEIKNLNNKFVNEYLRVMHSVFAGSQEEVKLAQPKPTKTYPKTGHTRHRYKDENDDTEENTEPENSEDEEGTYTKNRRPQYFKTRRPNQSQMGINVNQMYYNKQRLETQWAPFPSSSDNSMQKLRIGHHGNVQKGVRRRPKTRNDSPDGYSQQYHYVSVPRPTAATSHSEYGYHNGYPTSHHDSAYPPKQPAPSPSPSDSQSYFSIMLYFVPGFIKKIFNMILPSFTFEFTPHYSESESQAWESIVVSTPHNIFADDPFFDGFRSSIRHPPMDRNGHFPGSSRSRKGYRRAPPPPPPVPVTTTIDDFMIDARDRFVAAIEIGQAFKSVRKCNAIYSTCPFSHNEVVDMIEVIKQKLNLEDVLSSSSSYKGKRKRKKGHSRRKKVSKT